MIAKPNRKGSVIGELYEVRTGTREKMIRQEKEDPTDPGANVVSRFKVEQAVMGRLVWDGGDWVSESTWVESARRRLQAPRPKTVLRKGK